MSGVALEPPGSPSAMPAPPADQERDPRAWPPRASGAFLAAASATAVFAALVIPGSVGPGIGVSLTALGMAGAVATMGLAHLDGYRAAGAAVSLLLAAMATVRASEWLVALDLVFALVLASWAMAGGLSWSAAAKGSASILLRLPRVPRFLGSPVLERLRVDRSRMEPLLRGLALGALVLVVFGALFVSADPAFAQIVGDALDLAWLDMSLLPARVFVAFMTLVVAAALALHSSIYDRAPAFGDGSGWGSPGSSPAGEGKGLRKLEWQIPLVLLDLLFVSFVAIQIAVLFGGRDHVLRTAGLTYADYARGGFFQLVAVAALTIAVIAFFSGLVRPSGKAEQVLLRAGLALLCLLSLVIVVSALKRLGLYEQEYGFTRLRILVHGVLLWFAGLFCLILAAGATMFRRWLPGAVLLLTVVAALAFNAVSPDAEIARRNVERFERDGTIDVAYLQTLSADAVPVLAELPEPLAACALARLKDADAADPGGWFDWNWGRARARPYLRSTPEPGSCSGTTTDPLRAASQVLPPSRLAPRLGQPSL